MFLSNFFVWVGEKYLNFNYLPVVVGSPLYPFLQPQYKMPDIGNEMSPKSNKRGFRWMIQVNISGHSPLPLTQWFSIFLVVFLFFSAPKLLRSF